MSRDKSSKAQYVFIWSATCIHRDLKDPSHYMIDLSTDKIPSYKLNVHGKTELVLMEKLQFIKYCTALMSSIKSNFIYIAHLLKRMHFKCLTNKTHLPRYFIEKKCIYYVLLSHLVI